MCAACDRPCRQSRSSPRSRPFRPDGGPLGGIPAAKPPRTCGGAGSGARAGRGRAGGTDGSAIPGEYGGGLGRLTVRYRIRQRRYGPRRVRVLCPPIRTHPMKRAPGHAHLFGHDDPHRPRSSRRAAASSRRLRPPRRTEPARRRRPGAQFHGPRRLPAAQPPGPGRPDGRQGPGRRHGHRLLDGHPAGRPAGRLRAGQPRHAPRGRPGRGAPAVRARPLPPRRGARLAPRADGAGDGGVERGGTRRVLHAPDPLQLLPRHDHHVPDAGRPA